MLNETFLWLFNDNNKFEYTAGYKVKHNNFVSCEHLSTHNSKAEKSILHLVTAPETAAVIQKVTKHDNITQKNENRNDDDHHNNVVCSLTQKYEGERNLNQ